jgi:predicted double-glycine peptidase
MLGNWFKSQGHFSQMQRVKQITSYHCGPAVVKMLASCQGVAVKQADIVAAAGIGRRLKIYGMTVAEMGRAVNRLWPQLQLWSKDNASLKELQELVNAYGQPVGVEWQGVFEEYEDEDNGHYAVVVQIDMANNVILLADPFKKYAGKDRRFSIIDFEHRWWDTNEIIDSRTGKHKLMKDYHMMFIVTPKGATFPEILGMERE